MFFCPARHLARGRAQVRGSVAAMDAVTVRVEDALAAILELTGERVTEAVVDEVFARFCVGK